MDFDLAQEISDKPVKIKKNPGTPAYMAPEQLSGQPIDQRVDVFAFGVSAYELLTNQKPFPEKARRRYYEGKWIAPASSSRASLIPICLRTWRSRVEMSGARAGQTLPVPQRARAGFAGGTLRLVASSM